MKKVVFIIIFLSLSITIAHANHSRDYKQIASGDNISGWNFLFEIPYHKLAAGSRFAEYFKYHGLPLKELMPFIDSLREINSAGINHSRINNLIDRINNTILKNTSISIENNIYNDFFSDNCVKYLTYCFNSKKRKIYFLTEKQAGITSIKESLGIAEKDLQLLQVPGVTNVWIANPQIDLTGMIRRLTDTWPEYDDIKNGRIRRDVEFVIDPIELKQILAITTDWDTGRKNIAKQQDLNSEDIAEIIDVFGHRKIVLDREVSVADTSWPKIGKRHLPPSLKPGQLFSNDEIRIIYLGEDTLEVMIPPHSISSEEKWASYVSQAKSLFGLEKAIDKAVSTSESKGIIKLDVGCLDYIDDSVRENLRKHLLKIDEEDMVALELTSNGLDPISDMEKVLGSISYPELRDVIRRLAGKAERDEFRDLKRTKNNTIALMYHQEGKSPGDDITVIYLEYGENPQLINGMTLARYIISIGGPQSIEGSALARIRNAYKIMVGSEYKGKPIDGMDINEILQNINLPTIETSDLHIADIIYNSLLAIDTSV